MAYTDFSLETVASELGVPVRLGSLFPDLRPVALPEWLPAQLERGMHLALVSEKARSEFIVAPLLLAVRELSGARITVLSGHRLDVDPAKRLVGECDFILARSEPVPLLRAPLLTIVEAKKNDVEGGLGQCVAQMVAARLFNERHEQAVERVYGCVTTGETWQFLRLDRSDVVIDDQRYYIVDVELVAAALLKTVSE